MMKGPLLTQVEKSSSDPRWEESMDGPQLQLIHPFPTSPSHHSSPRDVTLPTPACTAVLTASSGLHWSLGPVPAAMWEAPPGGSSAQSAQLPSLRYPPGRAVSSFRRNKAQPCCYPSPAVLATLQDKGP